MTTVNEQSSDRERRTLYIVVGAVLAVLLVIALFAYSSGKSSQQADQKANQLIVAFTKAGAHAPSKDAIVRVFGDDGGAVCNDPASSLRKAILFDRLTNGAAGPGIRPVIADRRAVRGQLLVMGVYCPDQLPKLEDTINKLKTDNTVKG
jgi:Tfp pilus assembly protein FimT